MTPKQILDSFSETLMQDARILSAQERALVATLLQHATTASEDNPERQEEVKAVIASAVGETVAQRDTPVPPSPKEPQPPSAPLREPQPPSARGTTLRSHYCRFRD
jgi:hypothetical protein